MGLQIQVPGLSYFSIDLVRELLWHTLWSSGSGFARRVAHLSFSPVAMPGVPQSDCRPVWRGRRFFISSVADPILYVVRRWSPFATASGSVALS